MGVHINHPVSQRSKRPRKHKRPGPAPAFPSGVCRHCRCTDADCSQCIAATGKACHWIDKAHTICSRCADQRSRTP